MVYEVVHIYSITTARCFHSVLEDTFTTAENAIRVGPRVWTKHLIIDIDDLGPTSIFHVPISHIVRHCASVVGLLWCVRSGGTIECVPRGLQFFSFTSTVMKLAHLPPEVWELNKDSLRALEIDDSLFADKLTTPLVNVTHLTIWSTPASISQHILPSLTHLRISDWDSPRPDVFKDTLVSLHVRAYSQSNRLREILGALYKLEVFGFATYNIRRDISSSLVHSPRLKELYIKAYDSSNSLDKAFLDLTSYIRQFSVDLFPALANVTVSCDFPRVDESHTKGDIDFACQTLMQSLSSAKLGVVIRFVHFV
ncbi:hypothetical protein BD410DRAFT_586710 [Rickenella mellea]|uniref:F-box domain-containing protein n=1 Tax=Rickenella mellea TaxID=50990 RepID=A0A4Y7PNG3_9AGAM|nr:hypothetical protein BD410DRAFT_586710 [Rickenella mellea]